MPTQEATQIYGLVDANTLELRYIGQTIDSARRQKNHRIIYPELRYVVLEQESINPREAETAWIVYATAEGARLHNKKMNGYPGGHLGHHMTKEAKDKISFYQKGRPKSPKHIEAVRIANLKSPLAKAHQNGKTAEIRSEHARKAADTRWGNN